ncbi:ATP-dependent RNA helicase, partial [Tulasnella sp. 408]
MDVVTVHARPPQRLLRKRKRILDNLLFSRRAIGHTESPEHNDLSEDENNESSERSAKRRKLKVDGTSVDSLPWKIVTRPRSSGFDADVALMSLEEVDDVDIVYLDETKKRVSYNLLDKIKTRGQASRSSAVEQSSTVTTVPADPPGFHNFNAKTLLPEWDSLQLKGCLNRAIHKLGFQTPTEIQKRALPSVFAGRDVIGVAETGSGKTLAFGLPILNHILSNPPQPTPRPLVALILTPTRELAIQVADHLNAVASNLYPKNHEKQQAKLKPGQPKPPPRISVGAIVGGIDNHKQMRVIKRGMDIMVATPGRLWDLIGEDEDLTQSIRKVRFLVLDEADRMIETGHFKELEQIVRLTFREREGDRTTDPEFPSEAAETSAGSDALQTLVFSATLSKDLQQNLKKRKQRHSKGKSAQKASSALDELLMRLDFRDPEPVVVDLSPDKGVVSTLQESKVECTIQDKDFVDHVEYREAEDDIPDLQLDLDIIDRLKHRVSLARRIDAVVHKHTKADHEKNWLKQAAKDLDVEIDPDFVHIDDDDGDDRTYRRKKQEKEGAAALKRELEFLLKQPLVANGSVRIPVTWTHHFLTGNNTVDPTWMNRVETVVDWALGEGLWVILNVHHDSWEWFDMSSPTVEKETKFEALWKQIAARFSLKSERLIFEALNEPAGSGVKANADAYNAAYVQFLNIVRNSGGYNKNRITSLEPLNGNSDYGNAWFSKIPASWGDKWTYQFHLYSPYDFVWNVWGKTLWGTDADKAAIWQEISNVAGNFTGIPTSIGEFGLADSGKTNESASVWLWFDYVIRTARHFGFVTFMWDTGAFVNRATGTWVDPTLGQVIKYANLNVTNTLAEPGNATVWIRQGDLIVDKTIGLRFSGNTLAGVYNGGGQALTSGTQYTASLTGVTLKASYLSSLLSGKPLGSVGTIVIKSNRGADLKIEIRTIWLGDLQAGRLAWGDFDYNESNTLTLSSGLLGLIQSAQQAVTVTFEFWPRYDPLNTVPITISYSVRIPVTWTHHFLTGNNTVDPTWMNRVETVVDWALAEGLWVILNVHHDSWEWFDMGSPTVEKQQKFEDLWTQIAARFSLKSERLIFEALNEPAGGGTKANADAYNNANLQFQNIVRNSGGYNKNRITSLEPLNGNSDYGNAWFYKIPAGWGDKWSYQFHFYSPYDFLWNAWGKTLWGTDADKAAVWQQIADVAGNFTGIPTSIGEFGSTDSGKINESASVWLWYDYVIRTARHFGFVTFVWDNGSFFNRAT